MKKRDYRDYLTDMINSMKDIQLFTDGVTSEDFRKDKKTIYAVVRCFEVIGETRAEMGF